MQSIVTDSMISEAMKYFTSLIPKDPKILEIFYHYERGGAFVVNTVIKPDTEMALEARVFVAESATMKKFPHIPYDWHNLPEPVSELFRSNDAVTVYKQ